MAREKLRLNAPAKINWALTVCGRRSDGYHQLQSLMQTISLCDQVELSRSAADSCRCCPEVSCPPQQNLAWRAWELMRRRYALPGGLAIEIRKAIPSGGGLGGGSADAAAVLRGVNELFELNLNRSQLAELGFQLGADVPFLVHGGFALVGGAGETVQPLAAAEYPLLIAAPAAGLSTAAVFAAYDRLPPAAVIPDLEELRAALLAQDRAAIAAQLVNMLEPAALPLCPQIAAAKDIFLRWELPALMSGSGSCVFALSDGDRQREEAAIAALSAAGISCRRAHTLV